MRRGLEGWAGGLDWGVTPPWWYWGVPALPGGLGVAGNGPESRLSTSSSPSSPFGGDAKGRECPNPLEPGPPSPSAAPAPFGRCWERHGQRLRLLRRPEEPAVPPRCPMSAWCDGSSPNRCQVEMFQRETQLSRPPARCTGRSGAGNLGRCCRHRLNTEDFWPLLFFTGTLCRGENAGTRPSALVPSATSPGSSR